MALLFCILLFCSGIAEARDSKLAFSVEWFFGFTDSTNIYTLNSVPGATPVQILHLPIKEGRIWDQVFSGIIIGYLNWSPDGKELLMRTDDGFNVTDIWIVGSDGSNPREILLQKRYAPGADSIRATGGAYYYPTWSPDGSRIAYLDEEPPGGSNLHFMYPNGDPAGHIDVELSSFDWAPDGRIVYSVFPNNWLWVMNEDGTEARIINDEITGVLPKVSPDGSQIAFFRTYGEIWVMGIDGSNPRFLAKGYSHTWSPDSKQIAFLFVNDIITIDAYGNNMNVLFNTEGIGGQIQTLDWSPWLDRETFVESISWGALKRTIQPE